MNELKKRNGTNGYGKAVQIATGNGNLKTLRAHNKSDTTIYLQLHDAASAVAESGVPSVAPIPIPGGTYYESDTSFDFFSGLYACASSTAATKTLIAMDEVWITGEYYGK